MSRASLYRREPHPKLKSRRPKRMRKPTWTPELLEAVEATRLVCPMWGKAKLGPLLRAQGFAVSDVTIGRIIAKLVARAARSLRFRCFVRKRPLFAGKTKRLPKGMKAAAPGVLVSPDTR